MSEETVRITQAELHQLWRIETLAEESRAACALELQAGIAVDPGEYRIDWRAVGRHIAPMVRKGPPVVHWWESRWFLFSILAAFFLLLAAMAYWTDWSVPPCLPLGPGCLPSR